MLDRCSLGAGERSLASVHSVVVHDMYRKYLGRLTKSETKYTLVGSMLLLVGLCLVKTSTLWLLYEIFQISNRTRWAIRTGLAFNFVLYGTSIVIQVYYTVPHADQT